MYDSKADKLTLEPILGYFHGLDESQRCSPYPELFSQPDESKRAKKTLELILSRTIQTWMEIKSPPRLLLIRAKPSVLAKVHDQQTIQKEVTKRNFLTKQ
jgi:hypothetical protein